MQLDHEDLAHGGRAEPPLGQHRPTRAPSMSGRPGELEFSHERHRDVVVLGVHGELDLATAPALARELHAAQKTGSKRVVVDLSELEFMDSSGLHELLRARTRASERDQRLSLRRGPRSVQRLFELTNTEHLFSYEP